ncbi:glycosyltransferase family 9 protein [candidate division KSB1 bacterium]|nr:glycosyltransferase family 9 protein [candidate division KSB1 bacterium]
MIRETQFRQRQLVRDTGPILPQKIRSILVFELHSIGGSLLVSPVLRHLKAKFPKSRLTVVTYPQSVPLFSGNPYVDEVIEYRNGWGSLPALWRILWRRYDVVLDYLCNARSLIVALCATARYRIGMDTNFRNIFYTHVASRSGEPYVAAFNLRYLHAFDLFPTDTALDFFRPEQSTSAMNAFLANLPARKYIIGISPTGNWYTKKWPEERFAALCDLLNAKYSCHLILIWGPGEKAVVQKVKSLCKTDVLIAPPTSLFELSALINRMDLLITNDSANKHIAVSQKTPTITIYGSTKPSSWEPLDRAWHRHIQRTDIQCVPCDKTTCAFNLECLNEIHAENVLPLVEHLFGMLR